MKVLFTGRGTSGSWQIRGNQIAAALGAQAIPMATLEQCKAADVIVAVKRVPEPLLANIRASGRPWALDCIDAYPQPLCSTWGEGTAVAWLDRHLDNLRPPFVIWPNERMMLDSRAGGAVIYHHHRPGIESNPIRERIQTVGYEGSPSYLDTLLPVIRALCAQRGATFVMNPARLADVDVVLALRCKRWNGYAQRRWKSQVKLANAHGSGTPFIGAPEDGYLEVATGHEQFVMEREELERALELLAPQITRQEISKRFLAAAYPVEAAAAKYREVLCALKS